MPEKNITEVLRQFAPDSHTVKLCASLFGVVPGAAPFVFYNNLEGAVARIGNGEARLLDAANQLANTTEMRSALWITDKIDTIDMGIGLYTGVRNLLALFGEKKPDRRSFEADPQQATDAVIKALGLAYMVHKIFPGTVREKVAHFISTPAGKELAIFYAVAEVALPFADNLVEGGASLLSRLVSSKKADAAAKFPTTGEADAVKQAGQVLDELAKPLADSIDQAKGKTGSIMDRVKAHIPSGAALANVADSATGALATAVDMLPLWRFLGGRVVAEACVLRAMKGI